VNLPVLILSSLGGIISFLGLVVLTIRGIFKIVNATDDNTSATRELTNEFKGIKDILNDHETRLRVLDERTKRRGNP
jgi:hypothetical protein